MAVQSKQQKHQELEAKLSKFFESSYFDIQGMGVGGNTLDEAYMARVLTKLAIGSATVWWSVMELKDFIDLRRKSKLQ